MQPSARRYQTHAPSFGMGQHAMAGARVQRQSNSGTFQFSLTHPQLLPRESSPANSEGPGSNPSNAFRNNNDPVKHLHLQRVVEPFQCFFCGEKQQDKCALLKHLDMHNKQVTSEIDLLLQQLYSGLGTDQPGQDFMLRGTLPEQQRPLDEYLYQHPEESQRGESLEPSQVLVHRSGLETRGQVPTTEVTPESYGGAHTTGQPLQCTPRTDTTTKDVQINDSTTHTCEPGNTASLKFHLQHQATEPHKAGSLVEPWASSMSLGVEGQASMQPTMKHQAIQPHESENQPDTLNSGTATYESMASNISIQAVPPTNRNISCYGQGKSVPHVEWCSTSQNSESVFKRVSSEELSALGLSFEVHTDHSEDVSSSHSDDKAQVLSAPFEFDKMRAREVPCRDEPRLTNKSKAPLDNDVNVIDAWIMREPQEESVTCADDTSNGTSRTQLSEEQAVFAGLAAPCAVNLEPSPDTNEPKDAKSGEYVTCEPSQGENTAKTPTPEVCENVPDNPGTLSDGSLAGAPGDENVTLSCPICSKVLPSKSSLERHRLLAHLDSNAKQCSLCFEVLPDDSSLDRHRLQVHPQARTVLRKAKTVKPGAKAKTVKPKSKAKTIQPEAKTVQPKAKTVYRAAKVFVCSICSVELSSKSNLERHHYSAHTGVSPWKCTACSTTLPSWSSLARHRRIAHGETWECPICSKVLSCKSSLDRHHQLVHTERQPLKCPHCHKTFGWKQTLDEHIRSHTGERPFACHLCPYKFAHRAALWRHLRSHTNDRRFSCHLCPNSFLSRDNLTRHLRSHAKVKMYECSVCSARLSTSYGLGRHLVNMHNNHQLYACAVCDERFWNASELNAHVSKCHPSADLSADAAPV